MHVSPLHPSEKKDIVIEYMEGIYGKTLADVQKEKIVNAEQTNNPLYLKALLDEVRGNVHCALLISSYIIEYTVRHMCISRTIYSLLTRFEFMETSGL